MTEPEPGANPMPWAGRFTTGPDPALNRLTSSMAIDIRLLEHDIAATVAHAHTLRAAGLLDEAQVAAIGGACESIVGEFRSGSLSPDGADEDVHSLVERLLTERLGDTGARIHAGRSRNDLVATDLRLWCKHEAGTTARMTAGLIDGLVSVAEGHIATVMPGYTHLQRAQPVTLAFHAGAHAFALARDGRRFLEARRAADVSVLGAGALAGTTLPLEPSVAAAELGVERIFDNAMDAVSDRDFAMDFVYACAVCGVHLSRLAEEVVQWTSSEFSFARLADEWSTGSSMMPQKRNPDPAELTRGRAAGAIADLTGLLALVKGLPLSYNRDLQEDKSFVFAAGDRTKKSLEITTAVIGALRFDEGRMGEAAGQGAMWATDLAERLVGRGVPFRAAYEATGRLVAALEESGLELGAAPVELLKSIHPRFEQGDVAVADPSLGVSARTSHGGPAPARVEEQLTTLRGAAEALRRDAGAPPG